MIITKLEYRADDNEGALSTPLSEIIENEIRPLYSEGEFAFERTFDNNGKKVYLGILEDYSFRINSDMTITLLAEEGEKDCVVQIIVSGASQGIFGFSYGADKSRLDRMVQIFKDYCFKIVKEE